MDTSKAGVYKVKYSYAIDPDHVVTKTATVTVEGKSDGTETDPKSKTTTDNGGKKTDENDSATTVKTGDTASPVLWISLGSLALVLVALLAVLKRRSKR